MPLPFERDCLTAVRCSFSCAIVRLPRSLWRGEPWNIQNMASCSPSRLHGVPSKAVHTKYGGRTGTVRAPGKPSSTLPLPAARSPGSLGSCGRRRCHSGNNTNHSAYRSPECTWWTRGMQNGLWVQPCCLRNWAASRGWEEGQAWPSGGLTCEPRGERQQPEKVSLPWWPGPCRGNCCFSHASTSFSSRNCIFFLIRKCLGSMQGLFF